MFEVGGKYKIDFDDLYASFDKAGQQDAQFRAALQQTGATAAKSFQEAAQQALAYQQRLNAAAAEVRQAGAVYNELRGELRRAAEEGKGLEKSFKAAGGAATEAGAQLKADLEANKRRQAELRVEIDLTRKAIEEEKLALAGVRTEQQQQTAQARVGSAATRDAATAQREAAQQARAAAREAQNRAKEEDKAAKAQAQAARAAGLLTQYERQLTDLVEKRSRATTRAEVQGYSKQIKDTQKQIAELKGEADKGGGAVGGMFGRFAGAAGAAAAVAVVVGVVKDLAAQAIEAGKKADATLGKLSFARGGDQRKAAQDFAFLAAEADRLGLNINAAGASYGSFTAAAQAANLPLAEARRLYLAVGGAASVLKISSDDTEGSLRALQQMVSKGTVSAEELRGQLGERLPGAFAIAARAVGVTEQELGKMLQRGEVIATDFLPKFARELEKTFGDGTAQAADALQANTNRIDNEWQRFLLRFTSATGGAVASIAKFAKQANDYLDTLTPDGRIRLAARQATEEAKGFERVYEALAKQAVVDAKRAGADPAKAIIAAFDQERESLKQQIKEAEKRLKPFDTTTTAGDAAIRIANTKGEGDAFAARETRLRKELEILRLQETALEDVRAARKKAAQDEAETDGLLEALYKKKAKLTQERKDAENETLILEKGGLNDQLTAVQKEIDRLEGRRDKARKGPDYLKQLLAEEERLRKDANQKELALIKDGGEAKAAEQFRQSLDEIQRTENKLKQLEKLAGRDGVIDGAQAQELAALRAAAADTYFQELIRIASEYNQRLFDLQADSDQKELTQINRKYDKLVDTARTGEERLALETARARELQAARQQQEQRQIEEGSSIARDSVKLGATVFGEGTGRSVIEAKKAEKEALLKLDLEEKQALLNNTLQMEGKRGELARAALRVQIAEIKQALGEVEREKAKFDPKGSIYRLVLGENDSEENRAALDEAVGAGIAAVQQLLQADLQAQQAKIDARTRTIDELNTRLTQEIQLNKEGSASNIGNLKAQIEEEKKQRREAVEEKRKLARQQVVIDTITQASAVGTAAAQALAALSVIPVVGPALGIAAAGAIVAAFLASKAKAFQAANSQAEGFFKGGYTGDGPNREEAGPVHRREFVMKEDLTSKYRAPLFEALHRGRPQDIDWQAPHMQQLLPDYALPGQLRAERAAVVEYRHQVAYAPLQAGLDGLQREVAEMKQHTARLPTEQYVNNPDGTLTRIDLLTGNRTTYRV